MLIVPLSAYRAVELSDKQIAELLEVGGDDVGLLGPVAEGLFAAVDEGGV